MIDYYYDDGAVDEEGMPELQSEGAVKSIKVQLMCCALPAVVLLCFALPCFGLLCLAVPCCALPSLLGGACVASLPCGFLCRTEFYSALLYYSAAMQIVCTLLYEVVLPPLWDADFTAITSTA